MAEAATSAAPTQAPTVEVLGAALCELLSGASDTKIVVAGAANLARGALDFRDIAPVLDALEEQVVLMRLFAEADPGDDLHVSIGAENPHDASPRRPSSRVPTRLGRARVRGWHTWESWGPCGWTTRGP